MTRSAGLFTGMSLKASSGSSTARGGEIDLFGNLGAEMHDALRVASAAGPVATDVSTGAVVVLRNADIEALARDRRLVGVGLSFFDLMGITEGPLRDWYANLMFTNEGETHRRLRSLVSRAFTPRSVEDLRSPSADICAEAMGTVSGDGGDLIDAHAVVAMRVMCRMLGVPEADVPVFVGWADALSPIFSLMTPGQITEATDALGELLAYVDNLTELRAAKPEADLISALLSAEHEGERLTHGEVAQMIANLLVAGHDTTTSQLGCSLLLALRHRAELEAAVADDAALASAVAETMRLEPGIAFIPRTAAEPIDLNGMQIPAGSMVMLSTAAANRDPEVWNAPDRFVPGRFLQPGAPRLLVFGAGVHFCLGAALARVTVEECVRTILATDFSLSEAAATIPWRNVLGRSPARLLVSAGPVRPGYIDAART